MSREYILITGATGFIGSHVTEKLLLDKSYRLIAIVRKNRNYKNVNELGSKGVSLVEGNFHDRTVLKNVFEKFPVQIVIHIAALRGGGAGTREDFYEVNVRGTEALLEASFKNQVKRFIFCSSVGVFGTIPKELPANLNTELSGDNDYHNSKVLAEKKVQEFISRGLNAFIVRPTITYGKRDNGFPSTLVKLVRKKMLLIPLKEKKIHLLDVNKLAEITIKVLKVKEIQNRILIAGDESPVSLRELVDLIYAFYYKKPYPSLLKLPNIIFKAILIIFQAVQNEKWSTRIQLISRNWYYDISQTRFLLGFEPKRTKKAFIEYLQTID